MIYKKYLSLFSVCVFCRLLTANSQQTVIWIKNALIICFDSVIPSLYPFMVISAYISSERYISVLSLPLRWYAKLVNVNDNGYPAYLLLSFTGGFAVGGNMIKKLEARGYSDKSLAVLAPSLICNSFAFCVFAVGIGFLSNMALGAMMYFSCILAGLITTFLLSFIIPCYVPKPQKETGENTSFVQAVNKGVTGILSICGFVVIFSCMCEIILLYIENRHIAAVLCALCEVTAGCVKTVEILGKNAFFICGCLSLCPLCTLSQVYHFSQNKSVIKSLVFSRIIHTPICMCIFSVLTNIFPAAAAVSVKNGPSFSFYYQDGETAIVMFLISLVFILIFDGSSTEKLS